MSTAQVQHIDLDDPSKLKRTSRSWPEFRASRWYKIDRKAAEDVEKAIPDIKPLVVENRAVLRRSVRRLAWNGFTRFIDIKSGLLTAGGTHETVLKSNPKANVLYVDI